MSISQIQKFKRKSRVGPLQFHGPVLAWLLTSCLALLSTMALAQEPIFPIPLTVDENPKRVALGARLFSDTLLSNNDTVSCATCHPLDRAGVDGRSRAVSLDGKKLLRNTPSIFNLRFNLYLNWDGAHESLLTHTEAVMKNQNLMGMSWPDLVKKIKAIPSYYADFREAYPEGVDISSVIDAIATYERSLITPNSKFDRYLRGEANAMTADEIRGYKLFKSNGCVACHQGINMGGNLMQRFGVFASLESLGAPGDSADVGRFQVTKDPRDRGVYRVPSLRNIAVTGPYFHDGRVKTLEEAIWHMARAQLGRTLSGEDIRLIAAFLRTLTGEYQGKPLASAASGVAR